MTMPPRDCPQHKRPAQHSRIPERSTRKTPGAAITDEQWNEVNSVFFGGGLGALGLSSQSEEGLRGPRNASLWGSQAKAHLSCQSVSERGTRLRVRGGGGGGLAADGSTVPQRLSGTVD